MTYYLANWASQADFEALRDDGGFDCVEELAYPVGRLLLSREVAHVQTLLDEAWEDGAFMLEGDDGPAPSPDWQTDGWNDTKKSQIWWSEALDMTVVLREIEPLEPTGGPA